MRDCEYKGFRIPAGHLVSLNLTFSQTSHHFWHEPFAFDPERFSPARAEDKKHPFMFLPFGGGATDSASATSSDTRTGARIGCRPAE